MALSAQTSTPPPRRLADRWARLVHIYHKEIWQSAFLKDRSLKGCCYAVLRVISITITVLIETRVATRAAALAFSSLLGLGPLIALAVLIAGFALGQKETDVVVAETLNRMVKIVAPQLEHYEQITQTSAEAAPPLVETIKNIVKASQSGSVGALGVFSLIFVVLLMFKGVEDTFNDIWGVRQGRSVLMRVVLYWTVLSLGAVVFFTAVALQSAGTFANVFEDALPGYSTIKSLGWPLQTVSFLLLALMLTLFYRVIPNTRVFWRPASIGAIIVTILLALNNLAAFLYVKRVVLEKNLYGGLALPLVILSVLYIFWLCVLIGGIVSYAIQNVHFRNSQAAWSTLTHAKRERLELVVFLSICRRFRDCLPPISASHLSEMLKVPTQLLNECLNRLVKLNLVTIVRPDDPNNAAEYLYQPARPLNRITLYDFKTLDDNLGEDPIGSSLERIDPMLLRYDEALARLSEQDFFQKTIEQLLEENRFEESRPPFAMGERPART